jgi:hypothetical protein
MKIWIVKSKTPLAFSLCHASYHSRAPAFKRVENGSQVILILKVRDIVIHHRDTEDTEDAQR